MSEKRFIWKTEKLQHQDGEVLLVVDNENKEWKGHILNIVDLLNEQQVTINKQLGQIIELQDKYRILEFNHSRLEKRNKAQYEKIGEQQATIEHLTKSRDRWSKSAKLHSEYFNCLEKAIEIAYEEKPYPKIEDIMTIYSKLEKEIDDE